MKIPTPKPPTMKATVYTIIFCLAVFQHAFAQKKTSIGLQVGFANDYNGVTDNGNWLRSKPLTTFLGGVVVRHHFSPIFSVETGILHKKHAMGVSIESTEGEAFHQSYSDFDIRSLQIPLRLRSRVNLWDNKLFLVPNVGVQYAFNLDHQSIGSSNSAESLATYMVYKELEIQTLRQSFFLVEAGLGLEFPLAKRLDFGLGVDYVNGFQKTMDMQVAYGINRAGPTFGQVFSEGRYLSFDFRLMYQLSKN